MSDEVTALKFGTALGPKLPAAMYLAVCTWPDNLPQRTSLVETLLHAYGRATGWRHTGPDTRVLERRLNRAADRLERAFLAAEVAQLGDMPAEFQFGPLKVLLPSRHAVGPSGRVSTKRLQARAAYNWKNPAGPRDPDEVSNDFRTRIWRRWLPVMHYIIPLKLYIEEHPTDLIMLMSDTDWLDDALTSSERWADNLLPMQNRIKADTIRLVRT